MENVITLSKPVNSSVDKYSIVKRIVKKNPGVTLQQLVDSSGFEQEELLKLTFQLNRGGTLMIQLGKYYIIGPSSKERARRTRIKKHFSV